MHKVYVRELKPYSLSELAELLRMDTLRTHPFPQFIGYAGA